MSATLITTEDLYYFKMELLEEFKKLLQHQQQGSIKKYLKSSEVMELLQISPGTLQNLRAIVVNKWQTELIKNGQPLPPGSHISNETPGELCRLYSTDGKFLAILCFNGSLNQWEPRRVFNVPF